MRAPERQFVGLLCRMAWFCGVLLLFSAPSLRAQTSVTTQHNDISRTGQNTSETILTPTNVNTSTFGKLFTFPVDGYVYAQPLYMPGLTMGTGTPQAGTKHNVFFVETEHDSIYAFDADSNTGANAKPLWQITLLDSAHGAAAGATPVLSTDLNNIDLVPEIGITGTPVIDPKTNTLYVVGKTKESGTFVQRLHALDITTGKEKLGGPVVITASVSGTGTGSVAGVLTFDSEWQNQRAGLLLLNGIVYIAFASHQDTGPWHGWILGYNATTLAQTGAWCSSPNGSGNGIWMSGTGLAADVPDPTGHPFGRLFTTTGNGTFDATAPNYTNAMNFGDSIFRLDLANGVPTMNSGTTTVGDAFTPHNQAAMASSDKDEASGGVLILPSAVTGTQNLLVQTGKLGAMYLVNRDQMGGYTPSNTVDPQQKATLGADFGAPAYWNGNLYFWTVGKNLQAFSISAGTISTAATSTSTETSGFPGSTPSVSANGTTNGIVWNIDSDSFNSKTGAILYAHAATNVATTLYSSTQNSTRDNPGPAVKFSVPTVVNGKVYVGAQSEVSVYGLLNGMTQAATPVLNPVSETFRSSVQVTITDSTPGAQIFYTTDGTTPFNTSTLYTGPITVKSTETIQAIAEAPSFLDSPVASATYTLQTQTTAPTFTPPPGDYNAAQSVTIASSTLGATIFSTTDGSTPTTASTKYTGPVTISTTATLKAIATATGLTNSTVSSGLYTISVGGTSASFPNGFTAGGMALNGSAALSGTRLRLTSGKQTQAGSAWFPTKVNVQSFSTDFTIQITPGTNPLADGMAFVIQNNTTTALGPSGGGLGYGAQLPGGTPGILNSVAVKFDLFNNVHEGRDSTGLYTNGASPTTPSVDLTNTGILLTNTHPFQVHMSYNGTNLVMTITDTVTNATVTESFAVNIPQTIGATTAFAGFTGGTGGDTAIQDVINWTYVSTTGGTPPPQTVATPTFSPAPGTYTSAQSVSLSDATSGAAIHFTTDGSTPTSTSPTYTGPITVSATETIKAIGTESGFTDSAVASGTYTINVSTGTTVINFPSGFTAGSMFLNGSAALNGTKLELVNGKASEAGSAWFTSPVNVQNFTADFTFQITTPNADGMTFAIQNAGTTALGPSGGSLGYGAASPGGTGGIPSSVAIKFDLFSNHTEGNNSTGLYTNGASPTIPATTFTGGINLHSGDPFHVHITYDSTTLTMTITDQTVTTDTFTMSWNVDIPTIVGGTTAMVGFTGGTGGQVSIQDIESWTLDNPPAT